MILGAFYAPIIFCPQLPIAPLAWILISAMLQAVQSVPILFLILQPTVEHVLHLAMTTQRIAPTVLIFVSHMLLIVDFAPILVMIIQLIALRALSQVVRFQIVKV